MVQVLVKSSTGGVKLLDYKLESLESSTVRVKFLAAPINPLDILVLAGAYPVKPIHKYLEHDIPGYDGIAEIVECGEGVTGLIPGDWVVPSKFGIGTWRTHAVLEASSLQKIPKPNDITFGAMLKVSVLPAYFLVEDMANLKPGDWIVQNAATSVVAQMVVQFAKLRGLRSISIIRDRDEASTAHVKQVLTKLGADIVVTENELPQQLSLIRTKAVMLALDSVFGPSAGLLIDCLATGGTFVQLGFLGGGKQRLELSSQDLFGRRLTLQGFRGSAQTALRTNSEQCSLLAWLVELFNAGRLVLPPLGVERIKWDAAEAGGANEGRLTKAIDQATDSVSRMGQRKQVFVFTG